MVKMVTPPGEVGKNASDFSLLGTDNLYYNLENSRGKNGLLVMFICNHCPYVQEIITELVSDATELLDCGVKSIAIMSNDVATYPQDSLENMRELANQRQFPFPYVIDKEQTVAKAYGAVCTPDFFAFDKDLQLQYRGRIGTKEQRELFEAMKNIALHGQYQGTQNPSEGCSIKWIGE